MPCCWWSWRNTITHCFWTWKSRSCEDFTGPWCKCWCSEFGTWNTFAPGSSKRTGTVRDGCNCFFAAIANVKFRREFETDSWILLEGEFSHCIAINICMWCHTLKLLGLLEESMHREPWIISKEETNYVASIHCIWASASRQHAHCYFPLTTAFCSPLEMVSKSYWMEKLVQQGKKIHYHLLAVQFCSIHYATII